MLQPANAVAAASHATSTDNAGIGRPVLPTGPVEDHQSELGRLSVSGTWTEQVVKDYYAACAGSATSVGAPPVVDVALLTSRLAEWQDDPTIALAGVSENRVGEDLKSALIAATTIGMAHSVEMVLLAFSNHPLVRVCAVSHPYVLATFLESTLKRVAGVRDPDPENRTGVRYQEKIAAALVNWNHVQPALDTVLKTPLARCLKVLATAVISAVRDGAERANTLALLQDLPADAPPGPAKLTAGEALFINCLMCWLRNVGVDVIRQVVRSGGEGALPTTGPVARSVMERFVRPVFLGPHVPGAMPAAAISSQAALAAAIRPKDDHIPRPTRSEEILQQAHDPF